MFEYGKEQPITNNESLYEKKDGVDELCFDHSKGRVLNRYSFVSKNGYSDSVPFLIRALLRQSGQRIVVIVTWLVNLPGKSSIAAKVIEKRYLKKGWDVCLKNDHYIASKEVALNEINYWPPLDVKPSDGGLLLLVGNETKTDILKVVNEDCSLFLARTRYFAPNDELFRVLESKFVSALYQMNDEQNNIGIIFIGKPIISLTSEDNIDIIKTYEGDSAYKIFV